MARLLPSKDARLCAMHIIEMLRPLVGIGWVKSITVDNGKEFAYHAQVSNCLGAPVYFCHPYSAWQKGSIEAIHGQYRRLIPKGMRMDMISDRYLAAVVGYLNARPIKSLGWRSSNEFLSLHLEEKLKEMKGIFQNQKVSNFKVESA